MRPCLALSLVLSAAGFIAPASALADQTATLSQSSMLHDGPAARFPRLGMVERDARVTVKGCNKSGRWCEIEGGGKHGWVMGSHLDMKQTASAPPEKPQTTPPPEAKTEPPPNVIVETDKAGKSDKLTTPGKPVVIVIRSADGKVSSTMTVAAGSNVTVTASGRSRCELKAAVNP